MGTENKDNCNTHTFEMSGLGKAPFAYIPHPGQADFKKTAGVFWCEHCGTGLKNRHFVRSSCGKLSIVGVDCLQKTGDAGLIDGRKRLAREIKSKAREEIWMARQAAAEAEQRQKNGGLTDQEMRNAATDALQAKKELLIDTLEELPLIVALERSNKGDFVNDMVSSAYALTPYSKGQLFVLKEVYTKIKSGARKNSKVYKAAYDACASDVDALQKILVDFEA